MHMWATCKLVGPSYAALNHLPICQSVALRLKHSNLIVFKLPALRMLQQQTRSCLLCTQPLVFAARFHLTCTCAPR